MASVKGQVIPNSSTEVIPMSNCQVMPAGSQNFIQNVPRQVIPTGSQKFIHHKPNPVLPACASSRQVIPGSSQKFIQNVPQPVIPTSTGSRQVILANSSQKALQNVQHQVNPATAQNFNQNIPQAAKPAISRKYIQNRRKQDLKASSKVVIPGIPRKVTHVHYNHNSNIVYTKPIVPANKKRLQVMPSGSQVVGQVSDNINSSQVTTSRSSRVIQETNVQLIPSCTEKNNIGKENIQASNCQSNPSSVQVNNSGSSRVIQETYVQVDPSSTDKANVGKKKDIQASKNGLGPRTRSKGAKPAAGISRVSRAGNKQVRDEPVAKKTMSDICPLNFEGIYVRNSKKNSECLLKKSSAVFLVVHFEDKNCIFTLSAGLSNLLQIFQD